MSTRSWPGCWSWRAFPAPSSASCWRKKAEDAFRNPLLIAATLTVFGLALLIADRFGRKSRGLEKSSWLDAILIGVSQALAIIPGVSRSGSTIAAGLGLGLKREDAARFSFLMSVPIILGAGVLKLKDFGSGVTHGQLAVGFIAAAVFGFLSIRFLMRYVASHDYKIFVWYRIAVSALVLTVASLR